MTAKCKNCGKDFKTSPFYIKKGLRKFCSKECSSAWQSKFRVYKKGEGSPGWKGGKVSKVCPICGKTFLLEKCHSTRRFCSRKCVAVWQSKYARGENNSHWKGGISSINLSVRSSQNYQEWRNKVFTRDNFTCQKCGSKKSGNLQAHHIKQLPAILNDLGQDKAALHVVISSPDLWDLKNGITLCKACHKQEHKVKIC